MAEQHRSGDHSVSPLFNKMDSLMARHRGQAQDVPVLKDAVPSGGFGLMFDPDELKHKPGPVLPPPVAKASYPPKPVDEPPTFLDLPMLDLDYLVPSDEPPTVELIAEAAFDLEVDEPLAPAPVAAPRRQEPTVTFAPTPVPAPVSRVSTSDPNAAANAVAARLAAMSAAVSSSSAPLFEPQAAPVRAAPAKIVEEIPTLDEVVPQFPHTGYVPESATSIPQHALAELEVPEIVLTEEVLLADVFAEESAEEEIEIQAMSLDDGPDDMVLELLAEPEPVIASPSAVEIEAVEAVAILDDEMTLVEMPVDYRVFLELAHEDEPPLAAVAAPAPEPKPKPVLEVAPAPTPVSAPISAAPVEAKVTPHMLAEITATVGAQIAVEVTTEVAQLTRQHFSKLMDAFYKESLRKITEEIGHEMEIALMPRIEAMVKEELRRQGMLD